MGENISVTQAFQVVLIGVFIVFCVLIALSFIFYLFGRAMKRKRPEDGAEPEAARVPEPPKPAVRAEAKAEEPEPPATVAGRLPDEVVAVIAAAVAAMEPEGVDYRVRDIRPTKTKNRPKRRPRGAWAAAGVAENTRPF